MSRIGKKPISIPQGVKVSISGNKALIEGAKGKLSWAIDPRMKVTVQDAQVLVTRSGDDKSNRATQGLTRAIIQRMINGVQNEYVKELQIEGLGFKAQVQGKQLQLLLGFSHSVTYTIPEGVKVEAPKPTQVFIKGPDLQLVGQAAASIRRFFEPEPYKGKGIRYLGEQVRRKQGKAAA